MTEQLFPDDMANGLVDGTLPIDDVPAEARALADVLRAAHQPAMSEELSGMAAMVQQFTAEVTVPATTRRSSSMFATRLTRRAATMVAITLLAAGTAAASAGGALPSPFSAGESSFGAPRPEDEDTTTTEAGGDTTTTEAGGEATTTTEGGDATSTTETSMPEPSTTLDPEAPLVPSDVLDEMQAANPSLFGKCTAWTNGAPKNPEVPGFVELQVAADEVGISIDDFCDELLGAHDGDDADDADDAEHDDADDDDADDDDTDDDGDDHGNGNGNGNGNKGDKGDKGKNKG